MRALAQLPTPAMATRTVMMVVLLDGCDYTGQVVWFRLRGRTTVNTLLLQIVCSRSSPKEVGL